MHFVDMEMCILVCCASCFLLCPQGSRGVRGIPGVAGEQGAPGPDGPRGARGQTGAPGQTVSTSDRICYGTDNYGFATSLG